MAGRRKRRVRRSSGKWKTTLLVVTIVAIVAVVIVFNIYGSGFSSNTSGNGSTNNIVVSYNGSTYTFGFPYNTTVTYVWSQEIVFPNSTRRPYGLEFEGIQSYRVLNVTAKKMLGTEELPLWFYVVSSNNNVSRTVYTLYSTIALPLELLGKPTLAMNPVGKEIIETRIGARKAWHYVSKLTPRSKECYVFEGDYYFDTETGVLLKEETKCYPPPDSGYPNGTYVYYVKEIVEFKK